jgi:hypothetical protein
MEVLVVVATAAVASVAVVVSALGAAVAANFVADVWMAVVVSIHAGLCSVPQFFFANIL